jgi:hypothetical protein
VNLSAIRASVWMFYVVAEFAFLDFLPKTRYWRLEAVTRKGRYRDGAALLAYNLTCVMNIMGIQPLMAAIRA